MKTKQQIRERIREEKKKHSPEFEKNAEEQCFKKVISLPEWNHSDMILIYISYNHEMGTGLLIQEAFRCGKKVASPRVEGKEMKFYCYTREEDLIKSKMGILEPVPNDIPISERALMIMPVVAFDRFGNRVGYGGGYYDKYIAAHPEHRRIAIAYDYQMMEQIAAEEHDCKPDLIVTETKILC